MILTRESKYLVGASQSKLLGMAIQGGFSCIQYIAVTCAVRFYPQNFIEGFTRHPSYTSTSITIGGLRVFTLYNIKV